MKRNSICYLLAIIAMLTAFNVNAASEQLKGWSYCSTNKGSFNTKYSNGTSYEYHEQYVTPQGGGKNLTMYCTWPHANATTVSHDAPPNTVCELASTSQFPISYKLLKLVQQKGITDEHVLDIGFRMAGVYDRVNNGTLICNSNSDYQIRAFYNTYLVKVLGQTNTGLNDLLEGPNVDQAVQLLKESKDLDISDMHPSDNPDDGEQTSIFTLELVSADDNSKTYIVKANRTVETPFYTAKNLNLEWLEKWNGTSGKIRVSAKSATDCKGSITFTTNVSYGNSSAIYACNVSGSGIQHYIAIGPSKAGDTFDITTCPEPDCMKEGCGVVEKNTEFKVMDIHNCCEEGATTKVRQAALNELFCKDGTLKIEYYKPKCNAETYIVDEASSEFCKMYCGSTAMYRLPGPTHAKSDAYFTFSTSVTGVAGPVLNQYKRCRNIIYFDKWLEAYKGNNDNIKNALNDYNMNIVFLNQLKNATAQTHVEKWTVKCKDETSSTGYKQWDESYNMTKYVVGSAKYNRYKANLDTANYNNMTFTDDTAGDTPSGTYYAKSSVDGAVGKYNELIRNNPGCDISGNSSFASIDEAKANAENAAKGALANYNAYVSNSSTLRESITKCSGKADANGVVDTTDIKNKVKFNSEPEMEFSYNQVYLNDAGNLTSQELKIEFEKVDNKCLYEVYDSLDKPNRNSEDWNENWDMIGIYDEQYSGNYGKGVLAVETLKTGIEFNNAVGSINTLKSDKFYASKKFTTDAVGHMTCKWTDKKGNQAYTLIPRGIVYTVETESGDIKDLGGIYTTHTGTYQIYRTHAKGKFETYFTLKNLADGIFDDIIHDGGKTCAELYATINDAKNHEKLDGVNGTCYLEIENNGWNLYDCTQRDVIDKGQVLGNDVCCEGPNCRGDGIIDYKEVNPADMFPNEYGKNYAINWLDKSDEDAQRALKHIGDAANDDATYSKDELTYSFTLTPKDLKAIRAYNKSRVKDGGYTDFEMNCSYVEVNGRPTYQRCESKFLTAISGGSLEYGNNNETLSLKTNNIDLMKSRQNWN